MAAQHDEPGEEGPPEGRTARSPRVRGRLAITAAVAAGCAAVPFAAAMYGYGSYLRYTWFMALPAVALLGHALVGLIDVALAGVDIALGKPARARGRGWNRVRLSMLALFALAFLLGWLAGIMGRNAHCRALCRRCEPILAALDEYRLAHNVFPDSLQSVPEFGALSAEAGLTIREGEILEHGVDVSLTDEADAVVYLTKNSYYCLVPIEHRMIFSITRFYVYARESGDGEWTRDYIIWMLTAK